MKRKIIFLLYGFVLINIWSLCFKEGYLRSNEFTYGLGLSFTFLSSYFIQKEYDFQLSYTDKFCLIILPILYLITEYIVVIIPGLSKGHYHPFFFLFYAHFINPINIAFLVLVLSMTVMKDLSRHINLFIFIYLTIIYSYFFYKEGRPFQLSSTLDNFGSDVPQENTPPDTEIAEIGNTINLTDFSFINPNLDTIRLEKPLKGFILLETWNETCFPCIRAMKELPEFYKTMSDRLEVYYVYEDNREQVRRKFDKIFNFKPVPFKANILIDINQELYNALGMNGFPYFLLFDSQGSLIYKIEGYTGKDNISKEILEHIQ